MKQLKVLSVFGTRPEAIKMAPLIKKLDQQPQIKSNVCVTAQHREMLDQVLKIFSITPDYDLNIMKEKQTLNTITTEILVGLEKVLDESKPDVVLVHGDTSTTLAAALAAFYKKIPVGHIEAGLRTNDKYSPYPEEMNRTLVSNIADLHFAPTPKNKENLYKEGIKTNVYVTGNTVIDALQHTVDKKYNFNNKKLRDINFSQKRSLLLTAHRRENLGKPLTNICNAVNKLVREFFDIQFIIPVHLNPAVQRTIGSILRETPRVHLIDPLDVQDMHNLMDRSYLIMTDSGGLQEEAPSLGKPVLVLREETERPEAVEAGTVRLIGHNERKVCEVASDILSNINKYNAMSKSINPYGDGQASQRIVQALLDRYFNNKINNFKDYIRAI
ncbi:UDP-N-acetylglucosamine 2-epimerase (non-hydrolyzing) [Proteinivorax tanatarense]|uniref:UDP-N-acetylglucosamine 2-epimerase (non-hydrolyzing) n=1 Tax=Proteinivorax tanatarense TaxID=1260629 RepID=A0AAU7VID0_9FIRM